MSTDTCFIPKKGLDDRIAKQWSAFNTHQIAILRGLYADKHQGHTIEEEFLEEGQSIEDLTEYDIEDIASALVDFQRSLTKEENENVTKRMYAPEAAYGQLKRTFTPQQLKDRASMVSDLFSAIVDSILEENDHLSRDEVIRGFIDENGNYQFGLRYIFLEMQNYIKDQKRIAETNAQLEDGFGGFTQEEWSKRANQWDLTLRNLGELIVFANRNIRENEGYNIAAKLHYAAPMSSEEAATGELSFDFDPEQEVRESWQEQKDNINPLASVSTSVRRLLGSLREFSSNSSRYRDDLGNPRKLRVSEAHQQLIQIFRGVQSEQEMMDRLKNASNETFAYKDDLLAKLEADPILRTQFFVDFSKVAQLYGMVSENGDKHIAILNKTSRANAFKKYLAKAKLRKLFKSATSIFKYDEGTNAVSVNQENVQSLTSYIAKTVKKVYHSGYGKDTEITAEEYKKIMAGDNPVAKANARESTNLDELLFQCRKTNDYKPLIDIYRTVFEALGIDASPITYEAIVQNDQAAKGLNLAIANLTEGLGKLNRSSTDYIKAISKTKNDGSLDAMGEYISKIYGTFDAYDSNKVINRARFHNKDYFTDVQSSFLGKFRDKLKNALFSTNKRNNQVRKFLMQEYGDNPIFFDKETGKFRVRWMQDLATNPELQKSFANSFDYARLLGDKKQNFEDFGNRSQSLSNLAGYFSTSKNFSWYPSFILGDSGIQKFIMAPRYNEKTIMDSLVEAALQDIDLYKQLLAQKEALETAFEPYYESLEKPEGVNESAFKEQAKKKFMGSLYNVTATKENIFALLPFLNNYTIDITSSTVKDDIRNAIAEHLNKAFSTYIENLRADGLFDRSAYDSSKFADKLIQKLSDTEDLIKNPKGYDSIYEADKVEGDDLTEALKANLWQYFLNHRMATLNQVQMMTISPAFYKGGLDGNSTDFQKRYKEIHASGSRLSAQAVNPNTGERYSPNFSQRVAYFNDAETDSAETNPEFYEALQAFDEENGTDLASKYRKSASTDGQSFRTLDSYMRVMGMAGKMTPELLDIWKQINEIRADIKGNRTEFTEEEKVEWDELNAKFSKEPLTEEEHERLAELKEIKNGITRDQIEQLESLMVSLQPIKSFIYTWEQITNSDGSVTQIPVQIKHSECVVIPELLAADSKLRHMMEWAESNNIDMLTSDTGVKVGNFGGTNVQSATDRHSIEASMDNAFVHELSYEGYFIQQNNPEHVRESRLIGTQGRKVSFSDLQYADVNGNPIDYSNYLEADAFEDGQETHFTLGTQAYQDISGDVKQQQSDRITHPNAHQINQLYVSLAIANILEDFESFSNKISNPSKVRNILTQMLMNSDRANLETLLGLEAQRDAEGKIVHDFVVPLFEGGIENDNVALLLSMFRNQVNKQKMMGGSAIQASAYGLTDMQESENLKFRRDPNNSSNILYAEAEIPWDLSYTDSSGNDVPLNWNDWVETDGSLKLSDETITDTKDPRYSRYMSYTDENGTVHIPLIELRFPGILDLIATRIPTEAKYSMIPLKIVRFTHKVAGGGTIRLPLQSVTMAGFDYD